MTPAGMVLEEEIRREGPIPFSRFMEVALYHPEHGYYRKPRDPFGQHARGLGGVRAPGDAQLTLRPRHAELAEEDLRQLVVVMLAGMDQDLLVLGPHRRGDRGGLDELRPVADDG